MNNIILIGRLTKDPELRYTTGGSGRATFTLAVDKKLSNQKKLEFERENKPTADFIPCQAWGKLAEVINQWVHKGSRVAIQGRLETYNYQKEDGTRGYGYNINCYEVEFLGDGKNNNKEESNEGFLEINNDDIPF